MHGPKARQSSRERNERSGEPELTVATVAGTQRQRVERLLAALAAQTNAAEIEVVVIDTRPYLEPIESAGPLRVRVLEGGSLSFGEARAKAARAARSEIVAYLEDHCYPEQGWAEALARAYRGPWASVGYSIANANPAARGSRISYLANYGAWESPSRRQVSALPANNVSYRRGLLLELGPDLAPLLMADFNLHARLRSKGHTLATEPAARARHENPISMRDGCRGSLTYSRVVASERARFGGWSRGKRMLRAATILWSSPPVRLAGLIGAARHRPARLLAIAAYLPAILAVYASSALGEFLGYLFGIGSAAEGLMYLEVDAPREPT